MQDGLLVSSIAFGYINLLTIAFFGASIHPMKKIAVISSTFTSILTNALRDQDKNIRSLDRIVFSICFIVDITYSSGRERDIMVGAGWLFALSKIGWVIGVNLDKYENIIHFGAHTSAYIAHLHTILAAGGR